MSSCWRAAYAYTEQSRFKMGTQSLHPLNCIQQTEWFWSLSVSPYMGVYHAKELNPCLSVCIWIRTYRFYKHQWCASYLRILTAWVCVIKWKCVLKHLLATTLNLHVGQECPAARKGWWGIGLSGNRLKSLPHQIWVQFLGIVKKSVRELMLK